jgi:hypothetical protein
MTSHFITLHLEHDVPSIAIWRRGKDRSPIAKLIICGDVTPDKIAVLEWLQDLCRVAEKAA